VPTAPAAIPGQPDFIDFTGQLLDVAKVNSMMLKDKRVQLLKLIGIGSCCCVYKGVLVPLASTLAAVTADKKQFVAVKVYYVPSGDPGARAVLQQTTDKELWLLSAMAQPVCALSHVVQLYGTGLMHMNGSSYRFAVLELLGKSLADSLKSTGPASFCEIKTVM
jgi:hypothetical protein